MALRPSQLAAYDEELLTDRNYIPPPPNGFVQKTCPAPWEETEVKPMHTWMLVWVYTVLVAAMPALFTVAAYVDMSVEPPVSFMTFRAMTIVQLILVPLAALLELYLSYRQLQRRKEGFLQFSATMMPWLRAPLCIAQLGMMAALLLSVTGLTHEEGQWEAMLLVLSLQALSVFVFAAWYTGKVWRHNVRDKVPDAGLYLQDAEHAYVAPNVMLRLENGHGVGSLNVVENQGEVIRILERQKDALYSQVLTLQSMVDRRSAAASQEEAAAVSTLQRLVTAKDRELVALHAEKEALMQVQSGTWQLLDEREAEVHRLQLTRQQHLEENGRLRATLEEWSRRNAKLENKLISTRTRLEEALEQLAQLQQHAAAASWRITHKSSSDGSPVDGTASASVNGSVVPLQDK